MVREANPLIGLCEVSCEVNDSVDKGLKNEIIAHFAGEFHASVMRVWVRFHELARCDKDDNVTLVEERVERLKKYLDALKAKGVRDFLLLSWSFLYPEDFHYTDAWAVPDPVTEREKYIRFLNVQRKLYELIAQRFPEILYFEATNEPDGAGGDFLHKTGYVYGRTPQENAPYIYTQEEIARIALDLCYYTCRGVKKYLPNAKVLFPSFCNFDYAPAYLERVFTELQSGKYPSVGETKSTRQEDFFEIMSFHPYSMKTGEMDEGWLQTQKTLYAVMQKYGLGDMPVWYTELGWSDFAREEEKQKIGGRFLEAFRLVKEELPFVKKIFLFRLCTLANRKENEGEDNFGLTYNIYAERHAGEPKPVAITLAKFLNGDDYDVSALYKYARNEA